jgi:hypothetical protein
MHFTDHCFRPYYSTLRTATNAKALHWPEGLAKDYQLLFEAIDECEGMIYRSLDERLVPLSEQDHGIGKTTLMLFSHSDIQKCTQLLAYRLYFYRSRKQH